MPTFWLAVVVKEVGVWVNERVGHRVCFTLRATSADHDRLSTLGRIGDVAGHLVLPTVTLAIGAHAILARHHRAAVLEVLGRDHVTTARAKGLREATALRRHVLRNALAPTTTLLSLLVAGALTGVVLIDRTFRWRGMGTYLLDAVGASDAYAMHRTAGQRERLERPWRPQPIRPNQRRPGTLGMVGLLQRAERMRLGI